ncbi:MAG: trypsin-like serine protease [Myxococcales bacterium]|nr:trypsin-like serine protease [Myxococcales bacterium]
MSRRSAALLTALPLFITAACAPDLDGQGGERTPYVVNGQTHSGHPSAGKLTHSGSLCTATLVGKRTVLTAGHCVTPGAPHTFTLDGVAYQSAQVIRHPQYNSAQISNDIAIIILASEPPVQPAAVNTTVPTVGTEITIVGYGKTSENNSNAGTKRMAKSTIAEVTPTRIRIPQSTSNTMGNVCNGDSGGPSYAIVNGQEVHIGIHSTKSGACGAGGHDVRVDAFMQWIEQNAGGDLNKAGGSTTPPPGGNTPPDPGTPPTPPPGGTTPGDTTAPRVVVTYPAALAKIPAQVVIKSQITDDVGVVRAELLVDGHIVSTASGTTFDFPVTLQPGARMLQIVAYDAANNKGQASVAVTVESSATPPPTTPQQPSEPSQPQTPQAPPQAQGTFGQVCSNGQACQSGMCGFDPDTQQNYCTQQCSGGQINDCPSGAQCFASNTPGTFVCGPPSSGPAPLAPNPSPQNPQLDGSQLVGGCSVAHGGADLGVMFLLLLGLAIISRRFR